MRRDGENVTESHMQSRARDLEASVTMAGNQHEEASLHSKLKGCSKWSTFPITFKESV